MRQFTSARKSRLAVAILAAALLVNAASSPASSAPTRVAPIVRMVAPWVTDTAKITALYDPEDYHKWPAMDVAMAANTLLVAPVTGRVVDLSKTVVASNGCGKWVKIKDADSGAVIRLCHLNLLVVEKGAPVFAGQTIGRSGNTGTSSGAHLHIDISIPGMTCDSGSPTSCVPLTKWRLATSTDGLVAATLGLEGTLRVARSVPSDGTLPNLVSNGSFEIGNHLSPWAPRLNPDAATVDPRGANGYRGPWHVLLRSSDGASSIAQSVARRVLAGHRYEAGVWVRTPTATASRPVVVRLRLYATGSTQPPATRSVSFSSPKWTHLTTEFTASTDGGAPYASIVVEIVVGTESAPVQIDVVHLVRKR